MRTQHRQTLLDLLNLPTSPFNEQFVASYVRRWAADRPGIRLHTDAFGNLHVMLRNAQYLKGAPTQAAAGSGVSRPGAIHEAGTHGPLVLVAHMDHPGFEAVRMLRPSKLESLWRGGVPPAYFPGTGVRFWSDGRWVRGNVESVTTWVDNGRPRVRRAVIAVRKPVPRGAVGMWDFPDPVVRGSRLYTRGCDDVAGVAAILAVFDELLKRRTPPNVAALLSRAEEVGFAGALAIARAGQKGTGSDRDCPHYGIPAAAGIRRWGLSLSTPRGASPLLPKGARFISIECSSARAGGQMGAGPILRVGDLSSIFTPEFSALCRRIAEELAKRDPQFKFQRKLMDGGTCEASVFTNQGYDATGVCVALGNYHNVDVDRERIGPEYIDLHDWDGLVQLLIAIATDRRDYGGHPVLRRRLDHLHRKYTPLLLRTAKRMST